ncbi:hypothetical protein FOYG_08611 [Fusarium oxysporum NRRL 32931]|uniref:Secreted protein n=1 Tax=Fusarium oxysporum NRRL 32931 TaxID=660029 RepID=W9IGA7_FUSOX|nr:hypothetical protein FOYG_08611 [Fusarium oxysporum NRRL 32931]EWY91537.1 hypothetical protein FOYG_08611 [Fusarium oxysporum NRRL 32931]EWY91538.1 hypothetical protein FOYG_08611 [Fusarium oxysporum NRRL 32931]EWY91539.1 hypothetical protein FOYG_08611 [Fusarium oxysporum NRRL 32931]
MIVSQMLVFWPLRLSIHCSSLMAHERMLGAFRSSIRSCSNLSPKVTLMQLVLTASTPIKVVQPLAAPFFCKATLDRSKEADPNTKLVNYACVRHNTVKVLVSHCGQW